MKKKYHIISNTHWDREWRFTFQRNRMMLVEMIDTAIDILNRSAEYRAFHLDSQTIVIKDYLEIRPEKRDEIKKLVQQKRLFIGPWYILPDEFQVGGENLIRNLLYGHKIANEFGRVSKVGYSPFSWGQISQLPQIYREFKIDVILFYRGINSLDSPKAEFIWEGADGTRTLASRFSTMPRYNFYFYIYRPVIHNENFSDIEYKWENGGVIFHFADKKMHHEDYFIPQPLDKYFNENIVPQVNKIIKDQSNDFTTPHVIWMEGHDSSGPDIKTVRIIKDIKTLLPDLDVVHSTLEDYSNSLKEDAKAEDLPVVKSERRSSQYDFKSSNLYGYTTSARMYLKQMNFDAERGLQFYAEPFNSIAGILGMNINDEYLTQAWDYMLQNSAHDSIGGCSIDEVHEDMIWRYKQVTEISKGVFERACKYLACHIKTPSVDNLALPELIKNNPFFITVINPNSYVRSEVVKAYIDIPQEFDMNNLQVCDEKGSKTEIQIEEKKDVEPVLEQLIDRPMYLKMKRYTAYLMLENVPSFGYKTFIAYPFSTKSKKSKSIGKILDKKILLENEFLKINFNKNGTLNITHKQSKKSFNNVGYFYDEGELGQAWVHKSAKPIITSLGSKPKIKIIENGPLCSKVIINHNLIIPQRVEKNKKSKEAKSLSIELLIVLKKNSRLVEFEIKLNNQAENHRLRIMFPTEIKAKYHFGEGQFDVVKRDIERPNTSDWIEQPMYDFPFHHFVDVNDDRIGTAIISEGLKEYEVLNDKVRVVAITLFRAFTNVIQPSSVQDYSHQKGSQCLGEHVYRLAFYPHNGDWVDANVYQEALNFNNRICLFQQSQSNGELPAQISFIKIEPSELVFSCLKQAENREGNSFILRLYNPTEKHINGKITLLKSPKEVVQVTLEEKFYKKIEMKEKESFKIFVQRKKIISIKLTF